MARIKIAYIGGGSTRAPGTVTTLVEQADRFAGSELVLIDLDQERLDLVQRFARRLAQARDADLTFTATTDRQAGLSDCDAVLTSFRPGGYEARVQDEKIPLRHGVIGQETQGPGGFFMALRSITVMSEIASEMEQRCPRAWIFNYTNPVNIVAQALTTHTPVPLVSLCEGPIVFPRFVAEAAGLDPARVRATMIGLNHGSWSIEHRYDGDDLMPLLREAYERERTRRTIELDRFRMLELAVLMEAIPAEYFLYYYYSDEILRELEQKPTSRAEDIIANLPSYWKHYEEQAEAERPILDPARSRDGILELELALDAMDAMFNDLHETLPVNVPNGGALAGFPDDLVVEIPGVVAAGGIRPLPQPPLPRHVRGLVEMLAEYQMLAAEAAWSGTRRDGIRALASNPLVRSLPKAERIYDELAASQATFLPERLLG